MKHIVLVPWCILGCSDFLTSSVFIAGNYFQIHQ
jgi:hypothetical protein